MDRHTVKMYQDRAREWESKRSPEQLDAARRLARHIPTDALRIDVGCGPGFHIDDLGSPIIALDAARAMLDLARDRAGSCLAVQGDLESLPLRSGSLFGAWARNSYIHVPKTAVPMALGELARVLEVHAPATVRLYCGDSNGTTPSDDFGGRWFSAFAEAEFRQLFIGAGFAIEAWETSDAGELLATVRRERSLADTVGPDMRLLMCGLNPSLRAADAGVGYATPGNRFWPAAMAAGLISVDRDARAALRDGIGLTDLAKRATPRAAEVRDDEYRAGLDRVRWLAEWLQPGAICFVGLTGWRAAVDRRATAGSQPGDLGGVPVYVMPSTSGLNARTSMAELTDHLRAAAAMADDHAS